ncbi:putative reverse transcriptase domain-containing protein [Tanacetum coccineum]
MESDPEADPEEDNDEDPEEDHVDYSANGGDDGDDEDEPSEDDDDDDVDMEADGDEEEEEHRFLPTLVVLAFQVMISIPAPVPTPVWSDAEVARLLAISTPPSSPLSPDVIAHVLDRVGESLSAAAARPARGLRVDYGFVATIDREIRRDPEREVGYGITARRTRVEVYTSLENEQSQRQLLAGRLNMLFRDRRAHAYTRHQMETEARLSQEAWRRSMDASDLALAEGLCHCATTVTVICQESLYNLTMNNNAPKPIFRCDPFWGCYRLVIRAKVIENQIMPPRKAPRTRTTPATTTNTTSVTNAQLQAMIDQGVTAALAARDANRNGDDSHTSGTGVRRTERVARECTYQDFMKCQPLYFKGTEGVVELTQWFERMETVFRISHCSVENQIKFSTCTLLAGALTWWNSHVRIVGQDVAYAMTWTELKKKMADKYCQRNEMKKLEDELWNLKVKGTDVIGYNQRFQELALLCVRMFPEESDKVERYVGGLPDMIHGSVVASKPKTMQEATEMETELMDEKISTLVERQAENKRKLDNNNQAQQQSPKRQNVAQAYAAGTSERKEYAGTLLLCNRCKLHHNGPCTAEDTGARGLVHTLGGGETDQDLNHIEDEIEA